MRKTAIIFLLICSVSIIFSAKIFYIYPVGCRSTSMFNHAVVKILINAGHEVTTLSAFPLGNVTNHTDIGVADDLLKYSYSFSGPNKMMGTFSVLTTVLDAEIANCKKVYANKKIENFVQNTEIDLVFMELDINDCFLPLAFAFKVPVVGIGGNALTYADFDSLLGNPVNPSYIPTVMSGFSGKMNFLHRLSNTWQLSVFWLLRFLYGHKRNLIIPDYLQNNSSIDELIYNISLTFINGHSSFFSRPLAANVINIAGINVQDSFPLPEDIRRFIDEAKNGVVYVSLGSVVQFSSMAKESHGAFINVLKRLPYRIIWKHDKPEMVGNVSENILVRYWWPQKDILAHNKVILFISHGGIFSMLETIYHGVPVLSLPILYDQHTQTEILKDLEIGLCMDYWSLNENSLWKNIDELLSNNKYRRNMKKFSTIFKDRISSPKETFIYWVDYILRHKDLSFMQVAGAKMPFYQYLLLDVIAFCLMSVYFIIWIVNFFLKLFQNNIKLKNE